MQRKTTMRVESGKNETREEREREGISGVYIVMRTFTSVCEERERESRDRAICEVVVK